MFSDLYNLRKDFKKKKNKQKLYLFNSVTHVCSTLAMDLLNVIILIEKSRDGLVLFPVINTDYKCN